MQIIDFHTHFFPDEIAAVALEKLKMSAGNLKYYHDGTYEGLKRSMTDYNIKKSVALNIAVKPKQQRTVNNYAISKNSDEIICFGSVHPDAPDVLDEIDYIYNSGLKGIKLHPEYQNFFVDDNKMIDIYKKIGRLGLITVFHAGKDLAYLGPCKCSPSALAGILKYFDSSPVIAAHFGGCMMTDEVERYLVGMPVYFDTSFSYSRLIKPQAINIIKNHGIDKILFGTDSPWSSVKDEVSYIKSLGLDKEIEYAIFYKNAEMLLKI